jgi:hypothetical protein
MPFYVENENIIFIEGLIAILIVYATLLFIIGVLYAGDTYFIKSRICTNSFINHYYIIINN